MSRLDAALNHLAERGDPIGSDVLLERIERQLTGESATEVVALTTRGRAMEDMPTKTEQTARWKRPQLALGVAAAAVVVAVLLAVNLSDSGDEDAASNPAAVITAYRDAYNAGDIDGIMELFTDQSTVTGFPDGNASPRATATGLDVLRRHIVSDLSHAADVDAYTFSNIEVAGNTVTWDHEWTSSSGLRGCGLGHSAVVENGKIVSWMFAEFGFC